MIQLRLNRIFKGATYTIGRLYINGEYFSDCLEDCVRELPLQCPNTPKGFDCKCKEKIYSETAIPCGTYKMVVNYSSRFKRNLPRLLDVPHFIGILIHNGSNATHSSGCILVGKNTIKGQLTESRATLEKLMDRLKGETDIEIVVE